mgnify:CR=1 FL=1
MKEADKKVWIVPGKIRVASVFFALIVAAVVTTSVVMGDVQRKERAVQEHLAEEVLRFHVLANSDSRTDQAVKMEVRDAVLSYLKEVLPEELDVKETTRWMRGHTEEIRQVAEQKMADLQMQLAVTTCYFPDRTYGDVTFPAGNYKTLRIELGDAAGHNWWCVLYPNLCFLDTTNAVLPEKGKQQLKKVLTEEEYSEVTAGSKFQIRWFFWKEK